MSKHTARITLGPYGTGSVHLDDQEIRGVRAVDVNGAWDEKPKVTIELLVKRVEVDGEVIAEVPDVTAEALKALGWTPPAPPTLDT